MGTDSSVNPLLNAIKPWFGEEQAFLVELAKQQWSARNWIARMLADSGQMNESIQLLKSVIHAEHSMDDEQEKARFQALLELAHIQMELLAYDEAEDLLWQARNQYTNYLHADTSKEEITLWIAECRFGQGFVQDAIDRGEEILRKLQSLDNPERIMLAKSHQMLGWFYFHRNDIPIAVTHLKKAMEFAVTLQPALVEEGMQAEKSGDYQRAVECYFDCIVYEKD